MNPKFTTMFKGKSLGSPHNFRETTERMPSAPTTRSAVSGPAVLGHESHFVADKLEVLELGAGDQEFWRNVCEHPLV